MNASADVKKSRLIIVKTLYGALFVLVLPAFLIWLAGRVDLPLPAWRAPVAGAALAAGGVLCILCGMGALVAFGNGLPMNAFPPRNLVTRSVYALFPHPIYLGFVLVCLGASLGTASATGLWLITPLAALGCAALVWGHERPYLQRRHGTLARPWMGLSGRYDFVGRLGLMAGVMLPWLAMFYAVKFLGAPPDAVDLRLPGEAAWPVLVWSYPLYASAYLFIPLAFLLAPAGAAEKLFKRGWTSMAIMLVLYLIIPVVAPVRDFAGDGLLAGLLRMEMRGAAPYTAAFPSYHVVWSVLAAAALAERGRFWAIGAWLLALGISATCSTTGMHNFLDVPAGLAVGFLLMRQEAVWAGILRLSQHLANAQRGLRLGGLRILSHAPYSFAAGFVCVAGPVLLLGGWSLPWVFGLMLVGVISAGIWGQVVEGASPLQRPFGYFGGALGLFMAGSALLLMGLPLWPLLAALSVCAPWVQAVGRMRCLVQGCCHGRALGDADAAHNCGIVVHNRDSRVVSLSGLGGRAIYPTQLYSILGNLASGLLLFRLWQLGASAGFICGACFVLAGCLRFVEEGYRGEVQTLKCRGLPIYQWFAVGMLLVGCCLWTLDVPAVAAAAWAWAWALAGGVPAGLVVAFAMSVDFPDSDRRFARLST